MSVQVASSISMSAAASLDSGEHISIVVFNCPSQLLSAVESELAKRPKESNIIYAHAYKLSRLKQQRQRIAPDQFWVACYSNSQSSRRPNRSYGESTGAATSLSSSSAPGPVLDFIVSCTEGSLGAYPLFIYSNHPASQCTPAFMEPRMAALANALLELVSPTRVFSVFSLTAITRCFATKWTQLTGTRVVPGDPWYSATSSYCTLQTLRAVRPVSETGHSLRRAAIEDLEECANLCQEFAATSPPFTLTNVQARQEAEELIRNNQLWVYEVPAQSPSGSTRRKATAISTIVAVTRSTPTVSAITKVFTTYVCTFNYLQI